MTFREENFMREAKEFDEKVVSVKRVSKKTKGGNQLGFSALVVVGDKKGKVGVGHGKSKDVASAIRKAVNHAKKALIEVEITKGTIPHDIFIKHGAAKLLLKPAPEGSGIIAGRAVRVVAEATGIRNISSKILGTKNQTSNVYATIEALKSFLK